MAAPSAGRVSANELPRLAEFERKAADATSLLKLLANENRLLILCRLAQVREMSVSDIAETADLSQSAVSRTVSSIGRTVRPSSARALAAVKNHQWLLDASSWSSSGTGRCSVPATRRTGTSTPAERCSCRRGRPAS